MILLHVAEEIAKNVGSAADFAKMNRIQQDAIAKSVGMTREELACFTSRTRIFKSHRCCICRRCSELNTINFVKPCLLKKL
jgi:hypothetical protein